MPLDLAGLMALIAASRATRAPGMPDIAKSPSNVTATPMNRSALNDPHQIDPIQAMMAPADIQAKNAQAQLLQRQASVLGQFNINDIFGNQGAAGGAPTGSVSPFGMPQASPMQAPFSGLPPAPPTQTNPFATPAPAAPALSADQTAAPPDASTMGAGGALNKLSFPDARSYAQQAGFQGSDADKMAAIAMAESSGNPYAHGDKNLGNSWGITQINEAAHGPVAKEAYGDPLRAMQLAYDVSGGGANFRPWTMYKNGGYLKYMPAPGTDVSPQATLGSNTSAGRGIASPQAAPAAQYTPAEVATYGAALSPQSAQQAIAAQSTPPGPMMPERGSNTAPPQGTQGASQSPFTSFPPPQPQAGAPAQNSPMNLMAGIPPAPRGTGINPEALARGRMVLALGGVQGDPLSGAAQLLYNSPAYLRQKAEQEGYGKVGPDLYTAQGKKQIDLNALPQELGIKQQFAYGDPANNPQLQANLAAAKTIGEKQGLLLSAGVDPASPRGQQMIQNTVPDTRPDAVKLADAGNMQPGQQRDAAIQGAIPGNAPPSSLKEYDAYVADQSKRGQPVQSLYDWSMDQKKAGAANVMQQVMGKGQEAMVTAAIEAQKAGVEAARTANQRTAQIAQLQQAMQGFTPGATADTRLAATSLLRDMGLIKGDNVPAQEVFNQVAKQMAIHAQPKGQGSVSDRERELFAAALPKMTNSPEAINTMLGYMLRADDRDRQVAQLRLSTVDPKTGMPDFAAMNQAELALPSILTPQETAGLQALRDKSTGTSAEATKGYSVTGESEGRTATGPSGQKFIVRGGQWVPQ